MLPIRNRSSARIGRCVLALERDRARHAVGHERVERLLQGGRGARLRPPGPAKRGDNGEHAHRQRPAQASQAL
jgi:hypothetical protein